MANAGYLAPNVAKNVMIPHGVKLMFQRGFAGELIDLGEVTDISVTPSAEFLEYNSNQTGANTLTKRLLTNRGFTIDATLNEITAENLRLAFMTDAATTTSGDYNYTMVETFTIGLNSLNTADGTITLSETPVGQVSSIKSQDGTVTFDEGTVDAVGVDYQHTAASVTVNLAGVQNTTGDNAIANLADLNEIQIVVTYVTALSTASADPGDPTVQEFLNESPVNGKLEFQILNNEGGLAQIFVIDDALIAPNGAMATPIDGVQTIPIQITAQKKVGKYGRIYIANA